MNDLLPILQQEIDGDLIQTVNARDLHKELGIKKDFSNWIKAQIERGQLVENTDYLTLLAQKGEQKNGGRGGHNRIEYHVTLDAGKSIAMMSGGEKGKTVRQYFINCEKQLKQQHQALAIPQSLPEALRLAADLAEKNTRLEHQIAEAKPKVEALDRIATADGSMCITDAAKNLQVRRTDLTNYLSQNKWIYKRMGVAYWIAYQDKIQKGLLEHKTTTVYRDDGSEKTVTQARITPKGLARLSGELNQQAA